jgi:predicted metal-dependent hydrolase
VSRPNPKAKKKIAGFKQDVRGWAMRLQVAPTEIRVQRMTRKWASCSVAGRVTFSTALLYETRNFRQYVIVHELLHLRVPNHGRLFKAYLSAYIRNGCPRD